MENLSTVVDRLAIIKATMADLKAEESALKQTLIDSGCNYVEGALHRASVSYRDGSDRVDWQSVADHFHPSRQLITAHTNRGAAYYTVSLHARKDA